ncbi:MAG: TolC family protein [Candidatus Aminicenantales bacterium]
MPVHRPFTVAFMAALIIVSALPAQEGGLTLEKAVEIALAHNAEVLAAGTRLEAARGRTLQLGARPEPRILAGVEGVPLPGLRKDGDATEVSLGIEQVFEFPGKRSLRAELGRHGEDTAAVELDRIKLLVTARVKRAYWNAAFARDAVQTLGKSERRLDVLLADLQSKYRTGAAAYADILRVRADKARLRNQILDQERELRSAGLRMNELLGRPDGEPPDLLTPLTFAPLGADLETIWENARASRPSFRIAAIRNDRAAAALKLAGLGRNPDFVAGLSLPSVRPNAWGISFGLTMPFLRPGRVRGEAMEARAEAEAGRIASEALDRRVRTAVSIAFIAAKSAEEQVFVYERSLLKELEDELGIQLEYLRYGKTEAYSLLDLHRTFVQAEVEHLRAVLLFNIALVDLEVAGEEQE